MFQHRQHDQRDKAQQQDGPDPNQHRRKRSVQAAYKAARLLDSRRRGRQRRLSHRGICHGQHGAGQLPLRPGRVGALDGKRQIARRTNDQALLKDGISSGQPLICGKVAERGFHEHRVRQFHGAAIADRYAHTDGARLRRPRLENLGQQYDVELRVVHKRMDLIRRLICRLILPAERVLSGQAERHIAHRLGGDGHDQIRQRPFFPWRKRKGISVHRIAQLVRDLNLIDSLVAVVDGRDRERDAGRRGRAHLHAQVDLHVDHGQRDRVDGGERLGLAVHLIGDDGGGHHVLRAHRIDKGLGQCAACIERVVAENGVVADLLVDDRNVGHVKLGIVGQLIGQRNGIALLGICAADRALDGDHRLDRPRNRHRHFEGVRFAILEPVYLKQQLQANARVRHFIQQGERRRPARRDDAILHALNRKNSIVKTDCNLVQLKVGVVGNLKRQQNRSAFGELRRIGCHHDADLVRSQRGRRKGKRKQRQQRRYQPEPLTFHLHHSSSASSHGISTVTANALTVSAPSRGATFPSVRSVIFSQSAAAASVGTHIAAVTASAY